jgi:hypothetical protein
MRSNHANLEVGEKCRRRSSRWEMARDLSREDVFASDKHEAEPSTSCVTFQSQPGRPALRQGGALSSLLPGGALIASKGSREYLFSADLYAVDLSCWGQHGRSGHSNRRKRSEDFKNLQFR